MSPLAQKIQALLFVSGDAVKKKDLGTLLEVSLDDLEHALAELTTHMSEEGLCITTTETHVQLTTSPAVRDFLSTFTREEIKPLSKAAAEVLSVIAYRGPISRYDITALRGVDSRNTIQALLRRGVIQQTQSAGSTPLYDITEDFLRNMGITCKEELPEYNQLANHEDVIRVLKEV